MSATADRRLDAQKADIFVDVPDRVVEIGPGVGANFSRYREGTTVVACEPNAGLHEELRAAADRTGVTLELHPGDLKSAGLAEGSEHFVVSTLVLCSVGDQRGVVDEVYRILAPGGRFVFVEHVAAEPGSAQRRWQELLRRPWGFVGDGCDPAASTVEAIAEAGFDRLTTSDRRIGPAFEPTSPTYWGTAYR